MNIEQGEIIVDRTNKINKDELHRRTFLREINNR